MQKLPSVNQELALKLMENTNVNNKKKQTSSNLLKDERFKALFSNPDFQVDKNTEEYALLNPVVSQLSKTKAKKLQQRLAQEEEKEEAQDKFDEEERKGKMKRFKIMFFLSVEVFCTYNRKILTHFSFIDNSSDESFVHDSSDDDSSDDEKPWAKEVRKNYRLMRKNEREKELESDSNEDDNNLISNNELRTNEIKREVKFEEGGPERKKRNK